MIRQLALRVLEAALREWWITNTLAWAGVIALTLWLNGAIG